MIKPGTLISFNTDVYDSSSSKIAKGKFIFIIEFVQYSARYEFSAINDGLHRKFSIPIFWYDTVVDHEFTL